ncbi:hypothetical protein [Streptomyces sp. NPDC005827]|uniref:hypothetical protein n=1 Tax=Streptomyces sp. NPDC005827 TaxID=3157070 RepID=UPI0033D935C1
MTVDVLDALSLAVLVVTLLMTVHVLGLRFFWRPGRSRFRASDLDWRFSPSFLTAAAVGGLCGFVLGGPPHGWFDTVGLATRAVGAAWPLESWYRLHTPADPRHARLTRRLGPAQTAAFAVLTTAGVL